MQFSTTLLSLAALSRALAHDELLQVPAPSVEEACDDRVVDFVNTLMPNVSTCQSPEKPGEWTTCDAECSTALQLAVDNLGCCAVDYLETFVGLDEQAYATMAFPNVVEVCALNVVGLKGCAVDQCDLDVIEFQTDMMPDVSSCQQDQMPGNWSMCDATCASALQMAVTSLSCCAVDFLETFVGLNEQEYATGAFPNVIEQCSLDVNALKGCAVDQCDLMVIEYQNSIMPDLSTCESPTMPGQWTTCDANCSDALQRVVTNLECCAVDFLETFVGLNEQEYATMAFPNVIEQCDLAVENLKGCAVDECDLEVIEFQSTSSPDVSSCSSDMPGAWTTCDDACAMTLQSAIDTLDCCTIDFLETFVGLNEQEYATGAFPNVIEVCSLNVTTLPAGGCLPDECTAMIADFETPIDVSNTTCEITTLPGNWTACDEGCAASIQSTVDDLGCCTVDFLELFAGGDQPEYAAAAFAHVTDLCTIDLSNVDGSCVPDVQSTDDDDDSAGALQVSWTSIICIFATCLFLLRN